MDSETTSEDESMIDENLGTTNDQESNESETPTAASNSQMFMDPSSASAEQPDVIGNYGKDNRDQKSRPKEKSSYFSTKCSKNEMEVDEVPVVKTGHQRDTAMPNETHYIDSGLKKVSANHQWIKIEQASLSVVKNSGKLKTEQIFNPSSGKGFPYSALDALQLLRAKRAPRPCDLSCEYCKSKRPLVIIRETEVQSEKAASEPVVLRSKTIEDGYPKSTGLTEIITIAENPRKSGTLPASEVGESSSKAARRSPQSISLYRRAANVHPTALLKPEEKTKNYDTMHFTYWEVMYQKPNTRINKTWEDQGLLVVDAKEKTLILQKTDGTEIGRSKNVKIKMWKPDEIISVGPKEVQFREGLDKKEYEDAIAGRN